MPSFGSSFKVYGVPRTCKVSEMKEVAARHGAQFEDVHLMGENGGANVVLRLPMRASLRTVCEMQAAGVHALFKTDSCTCVLVDPASSRKWRGSPEPARALVCKAAPAVAFARLLARAAEGETQTSLRLPDTPCDQLDDDVRVVVDMLEGIRCDLNASAVVAKPAYTRKPDGRAKRVIRVQLAGPDDWLMTRAEAEKVRDHVMRRVEDSIRKPPKLPDAQWLFIAQGKSNEVLLDLGRKNAQLAPLFCCNDPLLDADPIVLSPFLTITAHTLQLGSKSCIYKPCGEKLVRPAKGWRLHSPSPPRPGREPAAITVPSTADACLAEGRISPQTPLSDDVASVGYADTADARSSDSGDKFERSAADNAGPEIVPPPYALRPVVQCSGEPVVAPIATFAADPKNSFDLVMDWNSGLHPLYTTEQSFELQLLSWN
ncbi:hypothetical protein DIPPA_18423 [Diplonema papillatum]|nr:hypothetical protein DIPPA_18423 [Diplonema papillatum]